MNENPAEQGRPTFGIGRVVLTVNDLETVRTYYESTVGLHLLRIDGDTAELGAGGKVLLELRSDPAARRRAAREAGLFHTAFLLPDRAALGRWIRHAIEDRVRVAGASDHRVSEAVYLTDPEGNGIEIYADRPRDSWHWKHGLVEMTTETLDIEGLVASGGEDPWAGAPGGTVVGHVHLQVGEIAAAEDFYQNVLGLDLTCRYPGGSFFAADGYHHHFAANTWNSQGAGRRTYPSTGLTEVEVLVGPGRPGPAAGLVTDPWGTAIRIAVN